MLLYRGLFRLPDFLGVVQLVAHMRFFKNKTGICLVLVCRGEGGMESGSGTRMWMR